MGRFRPATLLALVMAVVAAIAVACGTSAVDVQGCKQIEDARCQAISIPLCARYFAPAVPVHNDSDVSACIRFYDTQCLHGLSTATAPGAVVVNACVSAIQSAVAAATAGDAGGCAVVGNPASDPACAFLDAGPPPPVPDAAVATDASGE